MHPQIEETVRHVGRQTDELVAVVDRLDPATFSRRPAEGRWAVAEHLAHLSRSIGPYVKAMEAAVDRARRKGSARSPDGDGELRGTWVGRWFIEQLEPPPKRRVKTFGGMVPPSLDTIGRTGAVEDFRQAQEALVRVLEGAHDVDLDRARIGSPFMPSFLLPLRPFVRFSVLQGGMICAAHTDRHIWLVRETLEGMEAGVP